MTGPTSRFILFLGVGALLGVLASCGTGAKTCQPGSCTGCCDASGACVAGTATSACGSGGLSCSVCAATDQCSLGVCLPPGGGGGGSAGGGSGGGIGGGSVGGGTGGSVGGGTGGGSVGGGTGGGSGGGGAGGGLGTPITAPASTWTWVDFPDSACDDGTPTGIGVNLTNSPNVLVFFNGGGACWDASTCLVLNTATHGPFGSTQFASVSGALSGGIFDRNLSGNPFATWSYVFIPYCTGDLHGGQNVAMYSTATGPRAYHHVGHENVLAYLRRLIPTFSSAQKVVVSGSSAGGYGAMLNQPDFHAGFPGATLYVLDDSGPMINGFPAATVQGFFTNWRLDLVVDPVCGTTCRTDLSAMHSALATTYGDRSALLSSLQDQTISSYAQMTATQFQTALLALELNRIRPQPKDHVFFVTGQTHTMLGNPASFSQNGVFLLPWLTQFVADDPTWTSVMPP